jgi:outer membrane protein insertion porin family
VTRRLSLSIFVGVVLLAPSLCEAQGDQTARPVDSIVVVGVRRGDPKQVIETSGFSTGSPFSYRDVQRTSRAGHATRSTATYTCTSACSTAGDCSSPHRARATHILVNWTLRGATRVSEGKLKTKAQLVEGRPFDPAALTHSVAYMDSIYRALGYYLARVRPLRVYDADSTHVRVTFEIDEGSRVAISRVDIEGNTRYSTHQLVGKMKSQPEGFMWYQAGEFDDDNLRGDVLERLPKFYGDHGYVDFQVVHDTLLVNETNGKARLLMRVNEGEVRRVGTFEIVGNRRFSTDEIAGYYPFTGGNVNRLLGKAQSSSPVFNQDKWEAATRAVQTLYFNNGFIYMSLRPDIIRRTDPDGKPVVDLRWVLNEGQPAVVNRIEIVGNELTRERVIRDTIVLLPGRRLPAGCAVRSYQNVQNLGFFEQPPPLSRDATGERAGRHRHYFQGCREAYRSDQFRGLARPGDGHRRIHRARGAQPLRPGEKGSLPNPAGPKPEPDRPLVHRPRDPRFPHFGDAGSARHPGHLPDREPRHAADSGRDLPAWLPGIEGPLQPDDAVVRAGQPDVHRHQHRYGLCICVRLQ